MLAKRRKGLDQPLGEAGYIDRGEVLELVEANVTGDDWREAPVVGPAQRTNSADAKGRGNGSFRSRLQHGTDGCIGEIGGRQVTYPGWMSATVNASWGG